MRHLVSQAPWFAGLLAAALGAVGCADNDQSLTLMANLAPTDSCMTPAVAGGGTAVQVGRGIFDAGIASRLGQGYLMFPQLKNNLPSSLMGAGAGGMGSLPPTEMNNVMGTGFDIDVVPDPGQPITSVLQPGVQGLTSYTIPVYLGLLASGGGGAVAAVEVINANVAALLVNSGKIKPGISAASEPYQTLTVRLRGRAVHAGSNLFSNWISFPVTVCQFCLALKPGEPGVSGLNPNNDLFDCPDATMLEDAQVIKTCFPAQDKPNTCCRRDRQTLCGKAIPRKGALGGG